MGGSNGRLDVGIVGVGPRSRSIRRSLDVDGRATVYAVCDVEEEALEEAREEYGAEATYTDYEEMLDDPRIDGVIVATPQHLHAPQAAAALRRGVHVLSEVPAADSTEQARALVEAANESDAGYMMGENTNYFEQNVLVKELVDAGRFGELYYAEGNYLHETRELMKTTWRRTHRIGVNGITYPTHQLGPVLMWLSDDRIDRIACAGSGQHYQDVLGDYELEDTTMLMGKTEQDRLVKVRMDMVSNRPNPKRLNQYQLQGTEGYYESPIGRDEIDKIWLKDRHETDDPHDRECHDLRELEAEYLPDRYRDPPDAIEQASHGGADYFEVADWIDSIVDGTTPPIDVHTAMDMTMPGLISREAIADEAWHAVPDTRDW